MAMATEVLAASQPVLTAVLIDPARPLEPGDTQEENVPQNVWWQRVVACGEEYVASWWFACTEVVRHFDH